MDVPKLVIVLDFPIRSVYLTAVVIMLCQMFMSFHVQTPTCLVVNEVRHVHLELCRLLRLTSYRQFTYWIHRKLGRGVRRVIRACIVLSIRRQLKKVEENNWVSEK
jgi:hypothetical protein